MINSLHARVILNKAYKRTSSLTELSPLNESIFCMRESKSSLLKSPTSKIKRIIKKIINERGKSKKSCQKVGEISVVFLCTGTSCVKKRIVSTANNPGINDNANIVCSENIPMHINVIKGPISDPIVSIALRRPKARPYSVGLIIVAMIVSRGGSRKPLPVKESKR